MADVNQYGVQTLTSEDRPVNGSAPRAPLPRAIGSPLPVGGVGAPSEDLRRVPQRETPGQQASSQAQRALPSPGRPAPAPGPSGLQRTVNVLRAALPFVQRMLPLIDGNIASAVSNMLAPHHQQAPPAPPAPVIDLTPLRKGIVELEARHRELNDQVSEQNTTLKRVEDQLSQVREATDRNTLEQQELIDDLKGVGRKVNMYALIVVGLLAVSVLINVVLYLRLVKIIP